MDRQKLITSRLEALAARPFRAKFHLGSGEKDLAANKGLLIMRRHAADLLARRLFPAFPFKDGQQTPYKGHPIFVAQHATATCCRSCLENWHKIPKGYELDSNDQEYVLDVLEAWLKRELSS